MLGLENIYVVYCDMAYISHSHRFHISSINCHCLGVARDYPGRHWGRGRNTPCRAHTFWGQFRADLSISRHKDGPLEKLIATPGLGNALGK